MPTSFPDLVGQSGTINTSTNVISLSGSAVTGLRGFDTALTDGDLADGDTVYVSVKESDTKRAVWKATFANLATDTITISGTALTAIGTLTNGASVDVEVVNVGQLLEQTSLHREAIAPIGANITAEVNHSYRADLRGLTGNRNFVLPAGEAGDVIELFVSDGDASFEFVIIGDTGISINGGTAATEWSRLFITNEFIRLVASSATNWDVVVDGRIPCSFRAELNADVTGETANTHTSCAFDLEKHDVGGVYDHVTNKYMTCRRTMKWNLSLLVKAVNAVADQEFYGGRINASTFGEVATIIFRSSAGGSGTGVMTLSSGAADLSAGETVDPTFVSSEGSIGLDKEQTTGAFLTRSFFAGFEVLQP